MFTSREIDRLMFLKWRILREQAAHTQPLTSDRIYVHDDCYVDEAISIGRGIRQTNTQEE